MPPTSSFGGALGEGLVSKSANQSTGGLIGQLFGGWNARRQWKYQKKAMALQQQYALEQMNRQFELQQAQFDYENEYNSPVKVFERYRRAGINPAAVLGTSGASMSATMSMPSAPSGGHVSGSPAIGAGEPSSAPDALTASQIRLNNAAAENQQSSAELSDEKSLTEASVRNMLAATVDEKVQNAYFLEQKGVYQKLANAKTDEMLSAQVEHLRASADQLIASANLSEEQVGLVRAQAINAFFDSQLKRVQADTQSELGKLYRTQRGFVSLQKEDLERNIDALSTTQKVTTYTLDKKGKAVPVTYEVDGYTAHSLTVLFGAMQGAADAAVRAIQADWENPNQWNHAVNAYWNSINGTINAASSVIDAIKPFHLGTQTTTSFVDNQGQYLGGSATYRTPLR